MVGSTFIAADLDIQCRAAQTITRRCGRTTQYFELACGTMFAMKVHGATRLAFATEAGALLNILSGILTITVPDSDLATRIKLSGE